MKKKIVNRCGWCGNPTDNNGGLLDEKERENAIKLIQEDSKELETKLHNGYCCPSGSF